MPGVAELMDALKQRDIRRAVFTRNGRTATLRTLQRLQLTFDIVVARDDAPAKPDPMGIWKICESWGTGGTWPFWGVSNGFHSCDISVL